MEDLDTGLCGVAIWLCKRKSKEQSTFRGTQNRKETFLLPYLCLSPWLMGGSTISCHISFLIFFTKMAIPKNWNGRP